MAMRETNSSIYHRYTEWIVCPHCGYEHRDTTDYGDSGSFDCESCDKPFKFEAIYAITYNTEKE